MANLDMGELLASLQAAAKARDIKPLERPDERRDRLVRAGIPEIHLRHVFDAPPVDCDALSAVRGFLSSPDLFLILHGGVGTRKTGSAVWGLVEKGGMFLTASRLCEIARGDTIDDRSAMRRARNCRLLVLDDLGGEYNDRKGWFASLFNGLIDDRYSNCVKTIITSNLSTDALRAYGPRWIDRVRETGKRLEVGGESVRGK